MPWTEEKRQWRRQRERKYYRKHRDKRLKKIYENRTKRIALITRELGGKCFICGATEPLIIHHLSYEGTPAVSFRALREGRLILLCRKHHRAVNYVNNLKRAGYLDQVLKLMNEEQRPY